MSSLRENPNEGDDYGLEMDRLGDAVRDFWKAGGSIDALADMIQDGLQDAGTSAVVTLTISEALAGDTE